MQSALRFVRRTLDASAKVYMLHLCFFASKMHINALAPLVLSFRTFALHLLCTCKVGAKQKCKRPCKGHWTQKQVLLRALLHLHLCTVGALYMCNGAKKMHKMQQHAKKQADTHKKAQRIMFFARGHQRIIIKETKYQERESRAYDIDMYAS